MPKINALGHATYADNIENPAVEPQEVAPHHEPPSDVPVNDGDERGGEQPSAGNNSKLSSRKPASSATKR